MKTNFPQDETPAELTGIAEVLQKSLWPNRDEDIPPLPDDLRKRLQGQYGDTVAKSRAATPVTESVWSQLKALFAQPAFAGSLAALVLVGVLMTLLMRQGPKETGEVMRGSPAEGSATPTIIILFDLDGEQLESVKGSGYFEEKHLLVTNSADQLAEFIAQDGESIVVDGAAGEIRHEDGRQVALPSEDISDAVVQLLGE